MTWIQTHTNRAFDLARPKSRDVDPEDVAHALSQLCRFTGHPSEFYSVAEHSVRVLVRVRELCTSPGRTLGRLELASLLHDAHEAYVGDISRPLGILFELRCPSVLEKLKRDVDRAIATKFGLLEQDFRRSAIKRADLELLATEQRDLMGPPPKPWIKLPDPLPGRIEPWSIAFAKEAFLGALGCLWEKR